MLGRFAGLLVCIPSFLFQNNFQKTNVWVYVWCFKSVRILSLLFFVILCYCFFYNWNLVFGDYWHQPGCLPGEGIWSRALVLPGGQGENRWRMVGDLHGPWNGRLKHETSWNKGFTFTVQFDQFAMDALDAMDAMEKRKTPAVTLPLRGWWWGRRPGGRRRGRRGRVPHPKMAVDGWHSGVAT